MKSLIHEIHRRSLWQVLGIYLVGSWIALQVVEQLAEAAGLPEWVRPFSLALLVLGFPIVMATAFVQEGLSRKEPASPKQSPAEIGEVPPPPQPGATAVQGLLTWRNAVLGGIGAFALLGLLAAGWLATRALGVGPAATLVAQGVLDERDQVVLADFETSGADPTLGEALTEALRIELGNSTVLDVVDGAGVTQALRRMQRDPDEGLSRRVALELAVREGHKAVIAGEVRELAGGYQLSAEVLRASDGTSLAGFRETARNADGLIDAIDNLSKDIRQKAGESIRAVRSSEPLHQVSTASLEALQRYSDGIRAFDLNDFDRARSLLEEAVTLDSAFAMAHRKLGAVYQNRRENQRMIDAMSAAHRHSERLTRSERLHVEGTYHLFVTGDRQAAIRAFEELVETDPTDGGASNNLAVALGGSDLEREEGLYRVGIGQDDAAAINYTNLANVLIELGRADEALDALEEADRRFPDAPTIQLLFAQPYQAMGDYENAQAVLTALRERFPRSYEASVLAPGWEAVMDGVRGRLERARAASEAAVPGADAAGRIQDLVSIALVPAYAELYAAGDTAGAVGTVNTILARYPLDEFEPADRETLRFADFFVRAGDSERARALLDRWESDRIGGDPSPWRYELIRALVALEEGDLDGAIAQLERLTTRATARCELCAAFDLGVAHERAGHRDAAIAAYEAHVDGAHAFRLWVAHYSIPAALQRLGALLEARARDADPPSPTDLDSAAKYYAQFTELWAEADEELQARVRAAQARLEVILRERG